MWLAIFLKSLLKGKLMPKKNMLYIFGKIIDGELNILN